MILFCNRSMVVYRAFGTLVPISNQASRSCECNLERYVSFPDWLRFLAMDAEDSLQLSVHGSQAKDGQGQQPT